MKKAISLMLTVLLLLFALTSCGSKDDYSSVLINFGKAMEGDTEAFLSLFPPEYPDLMEYMGLDLSQLAENVNLTEYAVHDVAYVIDTEDPLSKDDLSILNTSRKSFAIKGSGIHVKEASKGYEVSATFTGTNQDGQIETADVYMTVILIGGDWYLDISSLDM